ncbi:MAG: glutamate-1-semialdehyde 2,1-aminomutase [Phycisphaerae bacterium]|nr:glutamate-1-semialdehyde 2,1-aminomutase [Phycisphaerae bacterium]
MSPPKRRGTAKSEEAYRSSCRVLPGGVNSPVRAFGGVGGTPRFIEKAKGAILTDLDGNEYIDYVGSWGPLILGHADDRVVAAVSKALCHGSSFGAPTVRETRLAELVIAGVPSIEKVRFVNSGTEATMSAIRLARGYTGRDVVIKVEGCYHGHVDALLVSAGSGATTFGTPSSPGVPEGVTSATVVIRFNSLDAARAVFAEHGDRIACLVVEPIAGNMGCIPPADGYLQGLGDLCRAHGALYILDEVMTGFRVGYGGAQGLYGLRPDLTCLGKIIGGGLPVGAFGGRAEIMDRLSPLGPVYQAGTLSGNPLAMAAGIAMLEALGDPGVYNDLEARSARLAEGLEQAARGAGVPTFHTRVGSMMCTFFTDGPVTDYTSAKRCDTEAYGRFFHSMLEGGVYLAPSQFECAFVSTAHTDELIARTIEAAKEAFASI